MCYSVCYRGKTNKSTENVWFGQCYTQSIISFCNILDRAYVLQTYLTYILYLCHQYGGDASVRVRVYDLYLLYYSPLIFVNIFCNFNVQWELGGWLWEQNSVQVNKCFICIIDFLNGCSTQNGKLPTFMKT